MQLPTIMQKNKKNQWAIKEENSELLDGQTAVISEESPFIASFKFLILVNIVRLL